jgi:hypothetical protein
MGTDQTQIFDPNATNGREPKYTPVNFNREPRQPREHEFKCADGATEISPGLAVAWDIGEQWKKRYAVTSLLDLENLQHREFHGLTHIFRDERTGDSRFQAIILSELISYLNDVDAAQAVQHSKYSGA